MNKMCHVLRHCYVGKKWWDYNKSMTKKVLAGKKTHLRNPAIGQKDHFKYK